MDTNTWSQHVAELIVDALIGARYINKEHFNSATSIVTEEIIVRLALGDYPPSQEPEEKTASSS